jgi:hypothetical protein
MPDMILLPAEKIIKKKGAICGPFSDNPTP